MSGPVTTSGDDPVAALDTPDRCAVEVVEPRRAEVGGFDVGRLLPRRARRMVGPWCFADHMGPGIARADRGVDVGPHPHIGLQTVTWLLAGTLLHRDSLGSEQLIRPGQLNLMTAGHGVSHSEETRGVHTGPLHGIQLWVAQPERSRDGTPAFEHHADLPDVNVGSARARVIIGELAGATSPARRDTRHTAAQVTLGASSAEVPLDPSYEHAVIALGQGLTVDGTTVSAGHLGYLGVGREHVELAGPTDTPVLLIGGEPFPEPVLMWWNYVARTRAEIVAAHAEWSTAAPRFGTVALARIEATPPPWPAE